VITYVGWIKRSESTIFESIVGEFGKRDFGCTQREENPWSEGLESLCKMHFKWSILLHVVISFFVNILLINDLSIKPFAHRVIATDTF